jgi:hypothetical protein
MRKSITIFTQFNVLTFIKSVKNLSIKDLMPL